MYIRVRTRQCRFPTDVYPGKDTAVPFPYEYRVQSISTVIFGIGMSTVQKHASFSGMPFFPDVELVKLLSLVFLVYPNFQEDSVP